MSLHSKEKYTANRIKLVASNYVPPYVCLQFNYSQSFLSFPCLLPLLPLYNPSTSNLEVFTYADPWLISTPALEPIAIQSACNSSKTDSLPCDGRPASA